MARGPQRQQADTTKKESRTKSMQFDVDSVPDGEDIISRMKELEEIKAFTSYKGTLGGGIDRNKTVKYVVLMYSHDSIFNKKPAYEVSERQMRSADLAGFPRNRNGEFDDKVIEKLFYLQDEEILNMIVEYLYYQRKPIWREIVTCEQELQEFTRLRMKPVDNVVIKRGKTETSQSTVSDKDIIAGAEKKDKLWKGCQDRVKYLKECYAEFFMDDAGLRNKIETAKPTSLESLAKPGFGYAQ